MPFTCFNRFVLSAIAAGLTFVTQATAQRFVELHSFEHLLWSHTNTGGGEPISGLTVSGRTLYGTTSDGGTSGLGTVFAVDAGSGNFRLLHAFTAKDGGQPSADLVLSGRTLFGTTSSGGASGAGTVFAINTDGTGFTNLNNFSGIEGGNPVGGLTISGATLYGTALVGGSANAGTVFKLNTDGTGFTTLHSFSTLGVSAACDVGTNWDGAMPGAKLVFLNNVLYGTTGNGGSSGYGTVFKINTDGTGFSNLHAFMAYCDIWPTNADGANPIAGLVSSGTKLYGTAYRGGASAAGAVFAINTDGSDFTNLYSFTYGNDGGSPAGDLVLSGNTLYGTASQGASSNNGTVFKLNTDGTGFTTLHSFRHTDGAYPCGTLILSDETLYGTTPSGGSSGGGTVFSILLQPQLTIIRSGASVILTWSTNAAGFVLQSTDLLHLWQPNPAAWTNVLPGPIVVNGRNTVSNFVSEGRRFYRLTQ